MEPTPILAQNTRSALEMYVIKRDGRQEKVHFDKITSRIKKLCYGLHETFVDPVEVAQKVKLSFGFLRNVHLEQVCMGVYKGVTTSELDELAAETAAHLTSKHPDYGEACVCVYVCFVGYDLSVPLCVSSCVGSPSY